MTTVHIVREVHTNASGGRFYSTREVFMDVGNAEDYVRRYALKYHGLGMATSETIEAAEDFHYVSDEPYHWMLREYNSTSRALNVTVAWEILSQEAIERDAYAPELI